MTTTSDTDGRTPVEPEPPVPPANWADDDQPTVVLTAYGELPAYSSANVLPSAPVGGRHRDGRDGRAGAPRRTTPTRLGRIVLPASLALVSGVALVAAWTHLEETRATQLPTAAVSHRAGASAPVAPSAAPSVAPTGAATPSVAATPVAASPPAQVVDRSVPVVVLNATRRTGLAAKVAARLRADGWTVVSIGNYRGGGIAATTVFAAGHAAAVATIRRDLPTKDAVARPIGAMSRARLTVVVGPDYPRG